MLLPPYDDSVSVPPKQAPPPYTTATAWKHSRHPADWTLLLMKPQWKMNAPHCLSGVQYIHRYIVATHTHVTVQPCMPRHEIIAHAHTHNSTTTVTSHPFLLFIYLYDWCCNSSVYPFCFCQCYTRSDAHLYAFEPGWKKALESLIDDSIYFYLCCVCVPVTVFYVSYL